VTARAKVLVEPTDRFRAVAAAAYSDVNDDSSANGQPFKLNTVGRATAPVPAVIATRPWESALDQVLEAGALTKSLSLQTHYTFDGVDFDTTSAAQVNESLSETDNDQTTRPLNGSVVSLYSRYYSHEARLLSTTEGPFSWIGGLYAFGGVARFKPLISKANNVITTIGFTEQNVKSWAAFGEGTFQLSEQWKVVGGLRYTEEERDYEASNATAIIVPRQDASFDKLTYRLSVQYRFADDGNVYFTYGRGFKSGVFNGFATTIAAAAPTRPETIDSFELGLKVDPQPWLRLNAAVFRYDYKDIQQSARSPNSSLVLLFNAASAKIKGGEVELTARASPDLNLHAYATYLDAVYDSFPTAQVFQPLPQGGNASVAP
jgi:iron complex outermembrane receptor protein